MNLKSVAGSRDKDTVKRCPYINARYMSYYATGNSDESRYIKDKAAAGKAALNEQNPQSKQICGRSEEKHYM